MYAYLHTEILFTSFYMKYFPDLKDVSHII